MRVVGRVVVASLGLRYVCDDDGCSKGWRWDGMGWTLDLEKLFVPMNVE